LVWSFRVFDFEEQVSVPVLPKKKAKDQAGPDFQALDIKHIIWIKLLLGRECIVRLLFKCITSPLMKLDCLLSSQRKGLSTVIVAKTEGELRDEMAEDEIGL